MAEKKEIGSISIIVDDSTGMYEIGEVDGGFKTELLRSHIRQYGVEGIIMKLAHMQKTALDISYTLNYEISSQDLNVKHQPHFGLEPLGPSE